MAVISCSSSQSSAVVLKNTMNCTSCAWNYVRIDVVDELRRGLEVLVIAPDITVSFVLDRLKSVRELNHANSLRRVFGTHSRPHSSCAKKPGWQSGSRCSRSNASSSESSALRDSTRNWKMQNPKANTSASTDAPPHVAVRSLIRV